MFNLSIRHVRITRQALEDAHKRGLEVQANYKVHYRKYWYDIYILHSPGFCVTAIIEAA